GLPGNRWWFPKTSSHDEDSFVRALHLVNKRSGYRLLHQALKTPHRPFPPVLAPVEQPLVNTPRDERVAVTSVEKMGFSGGPMNLSAARAILDNPGQKGPRLESVACDPLQAMAPLIPRLDAHPGPWRPMGSDRDGPRGVGLDRGSW